MYINEKTLQTFQTKRAACASVRDVSFPIDASDAVLAAHGIHTVDPNEPDWSDTSLVYTATHVDFDSATGRWQQQWSARQKTQEEVAVETQHFISYIADIAQTRLDDFAKTRGYDDIKSASDYAGCSVPKFDVEGRYCRDARAETWAKLYEILGQVESGARPIPSSFAEIEPELPSLSWPTS